MKISIGSRIKDTPWGGGSQVAKCLADGLRRAGQAVRFDLSDPDIDIILLTEPRCSETATFDHLDIHRYHNSTNPDAIVVHRINNSSAARQDPVGRYNRFQIQVNRSVADHTIFLSHWLADQYARSGYQSPDFSVLLNGGDPRLWNFRKREKPSNQFKLVTHHWSDNLKKGADVYLMLDDMLTSKAWEGKLAFTHVGRKPASLRLPATRHVPPCFGRDLVAEMHQHHIYITGAQNEAAGMHHIEGALTGLPLLYRDSGGLPEYCEGFGVPFTPGTLETALKRMLTEYDSHTAAMPNYPHTAERMCRDYLGLFEDLVKNRTQLLRVRRPMVRRSCAALTLIARRMDNVYWRLVRRIVARRQPTDSEQGAERA